MSGPSFIFGAGTQYKSQEQLDEARKRVRSMIDGKGPEDYSRPGGWLYALGDGLGAALEQRRINKGQGEFDKNRASADAEFLNGAGSGFAPAFPANVAAGGSTAPIESGDYFSKIRSAESGGNDSAKNPLSSATGRYQFTTPTWNQLAQQNPELGLTPDGRNDPDQQERAIRAFTKQNAGVLGNAGIEASNPNLYAAHFLGAGGATKVLSQADNAPVASIVGQDVVRANPFLANMTVGDFKNWTAKKVGGNGGGVQVASLDPSAGMASYAPQAQAQPSGAASAINQVAPVNGNMTQQQVVNGQRRVAQSMGYADGRPVQSAALSPSAPIDNSNYPEAGKIAPVDWTNQPQLSVAAGMQFANGQQQQGQQIASLPPQQPQTQQAGQDGRLPGVSDAMLRTNDQMMGGMFAPKGQEPVQVADNGGYFPPAPSMSGAPQQPAQQGGNRMQYLARALSNPFLSPEMKRIAASQYQQEMERQQQASDPAYQLDLRYKQAQLDTLNRKPDARFKPLITTEERAAYGIPKDDKRPYQIGPDGKLDAIGNGQNISVVTGQADERKALAEQLGLKPGDPAYQSYVLTGKMPREDAQNLTATDKKAILEADEMVMNNQNAIDQLTSTISGEPGKTLNDRAGYGLTAGAQSWAARNDPFGIFSDEKGQATTDFNNIVLGQALAGLKATFGGNPTEGERQILLDLQASVDKSPAERKSIIDRGIALANKRLEFNKQRASELRGGTFYKPNGGSGPAQAAPADDGWQDLGGGVRVRVK